MTSPSTAMWTAHPLAATTAIPRDPRSATDVGPEADPGADRLPIASHWTLFRRRFLRHKLACIGGLLVIAAYVVVAFADFFAYADPQGSDAQRALVPPQSIRWLSEGRFDPHVLGLKRSRNADTFAIDYSEDPEAVLPIVLFGKGYPYRLWGFIPLDRHLLAPTGGGRHGDLFLLGSDALGRDMFSRIVVGMRTSLTIGLMAVAISVVLGVTLGGISGYYGGLVDVVIQRLIEVIRAIPTIPLWLGLAVAIPPEWGVVSVYFAITLIISLLGWTELAREIRGRVIALRHEDFIVAAELCGARPRRIIAVHLIPLCMSHIIASTTLALPAMIISETALSFLGLGLRAPAISLGVLLNGAQNIQSVALYPWLLWPALPTALVILAFNFLGDGLRDAADPYA